MKYNNNRIWENERRDLKEQIDSGIGDINRLLR